MDKKWEVNSFRGTQTYTLPSGSMIEQPVCQVFAGDVSIALISEPNQEKNATLIAASPDMFEALAYAAEIIKVARRYFPKAISNRDKFDLENTNAAITKALTKARGETHANENAWVGDYDVIASTTAVAGIHSHGDTRTIVYRSGPLKGDEINQVHEGNEENGFWQDVD